MNESDIFQQLLYTGGSALIGLLGVGVGSLTSAWASKVRNQTLAHVIRNTNDVVMQVVKSLYETHVKPRTKAQPLSDYQQRYVRSLALQQVKDYLGQEGVKNLRRTLGNDVDIDTVLRHHLEAAVLDLKGQRAAQGGGVPAIQAPDPDALLANIDLLPPERRPYPPSEPRALHNGMQQEET